MEAQLERPSLGHGHHQHEDAGLHSVVEGEDERDHEEHHDDEGEKKSVLKKVKDKAKKMKDTLKKHVHRDNQDHQVQGPPCMIESTVVKSKNLPREGNTTNLEKPRERHHHHHQSHESENKNIISGKQDEVDHRFDENLSSGDDRPSPPVSRDNIINNEFDSMSDVRAYFTPGDEDKALSEVTVSEEVAGRLGPADGSKREGEDALAAGEESSGNGLTDRFKDALNSWLAKSAGIQTAQDSLTNAFVNNSAASGSNDNNPPTTHP
ncbi:hypothetical protein C2S53_014953 [Perilla frutescens var. hirtella]|uniref:LTI65/LTI78 N-terminal domain-containing protein n=1 Tax=Perilla frutescens var. hirtella TaxID=608512 RepID=A0AAD4J6Q3_PERFH|nr:hypothetical protein C2S53_014953 [Perilla frutescens var. hirtella]